jgi:hypothetical protein
MRSFSLFIYNKNLRFYFYLISYRLGILHFNGRIFHLQPSAELIAMISFLNGYNFKMASGFRPINTTVYQINLDRFYGLYHNKFPYDTILDEILRLDEIQRFDFNAQNMNNFQK